MDTTGKCFLAGLSVFLATCAVPSNANAPRDASVEARLASCDAAVVRSAADEVFRDPETLREPLILFRAALGERMVGNRQQAAFLYLAG